MLDGEVGPCHFCNHENGDTKHDLLHLARSKMQIICFIHTTKNVPQWEFPPKIIFCEIFKIPSEEE